MDIDSLRWTIPGVVLLFFFNRNHSQKSAPISNWEYIVTLVFISSIYSEIIVSPLKYAFQQNFLKDVSDCIPGSFIFIIKNIIFPALLGGWAAQFYSHIKRNELHSDLFIRVCQQCKGEIIFLTLKSKKIYTGILLEYPETVSSYSQHILIIPITSDTRLSSGETQWVTKYPETKNENSEIIKLIISKEEIVTMAPWSKTAEFSSALSQNTE